MVHLAIAFRLLPTLGEPDLGQLLLGSISPDGIHMRRGTTRADKRRVHLFVDGDLLSDRFSRVDQLRARVDHRVPRGFLTGWMTHLVSDCLWSKYVVHTLWETHTSQETEKTRKERYYRETDTADFLLYSAAGWKDEAWRELRAAEAHSFEQYLLSEEIAGWRDRLLRWFTDLKVEAPGEPEFFTTELITDFIEFAAAVLHEGFASDFRAVGRRMEEARESEFENWRRDDAGRKWPREVPRGSSRK